MHDIIDSKSLAILHVSLRWESDLANHVEMFYVPLNVWWELDLFPHSLAQALAGQRAGFVLKASFSNRWFPPKVVRIWTELLEWERPGLVLGYFLLNGAFDHLYTFSARGWPRPVSDRYFPQVPVSDPVYAVWGQTRV